MTRRRTRAERDPLESANAQRILRVAERLFARRGYRNVAVRDIAEAAHVTHPLIYHYFGSKRGLLAAVLERSQSRMRAAPIDGEPLDVVATLARDNLTSYRLYYLILVRAFVDGMHPGDWPGGYPTIEKLLKVLDRRPATPRRPTLRDVELRELARRRRGRGRGLGTARGRAARGPWAVTGEQGRSPRARRPCVHGDPAPGTPARRLLTPVARRSRLATPGFARPALTEGES